MTCSAEGEQSVAVAPTVQPPVMEGDPTAAANLVLPVLSLVLEWFYEIAGGQGYAPHTLSLFTIINPFQEAQLEKATQLLLISIYSPSTSQL